MDYKIIHLEPFKVFGLTITGKNEQGEIPKLWGEFTTRLKSETVSMEKPCYGLCYDMNHDGTFTYMSATLFEEGEDVPVGMQKREIAGGKYAIFTFKDELSKLPAFFTQIYEKFLPENGLERGEGEDMEYYDERFDISGEIDIYIPVK